MDSITSCFSKYITFAGRASRSEFWWFVLFVYVTGSILTALDATMFGANAFMIAGFSFSYGAGAMGSIFSLIVFLPTWAVEVRRLHDIGKSGWWLLLILLPLIGSIILLIWFIRKGTDGDNAYGPDSLA